MPVDDLAAARAGACDDYAAAGAADDGSWLSTNPPMARWLLDELAREGPAARERDRARRRTSRTGPWWGWADVKRGLEALFRVGRRRRVPAARRFERVYALPEQVLPARSSSVEVDRARGARAAGRPRGPRARRRHRRRPRRLLPAQGGRRRCRRSASSRSGRACCPSRSTAGRAPAWLHRDARLPRRVEADALLSPFDPVVWQRPRAERLFGFHYRIEIYTPAAEARVRLLRAAGAAGRPARRPRRPQERPAGGRAARAGVVARARPARSTAARLAAAAAAGPPPGRASTGVEVCAEGRPRRSPRLAARVVELELGSSAMRSRGARPGRRWEGAC